MHFAGARDYLRAVQYYCRAGETALRRSAYRELTDYCKEGLDLLERLPDTPERRRQELALRMTLHQAVVLQIWIACFKPSGPPSLRHSVRENAA